MSFEVLNLIHQLQQKPGFDKLIKNDQLPKTEQVQAIAFNRRKIPPSFFKKPIKKTLIEITPDSGFIKYPKLEVPKFSFENPSNVEPIGLKSMNSLCSGTIFTQIINGIEQKYMVTIGHCLSDEMKLLLGDNIQILTDLRSNYEGAKLLDPAIAVPLEVFDKLNGKIQIIPLIGYVPNEVKELMQNYSTSSICDISNPTNFYNGNIITLVENSDNPKPFQVGKSAITGQPGKSGSVIWVEGKLEDGEVCLNPKLMTSHGISKNNIEVTPKMVVPQYRGDYPTIENDAFSKNSTSNTTRKFGGRPLETTFIKSAGFIDLSNPTENIVEAEYKLQELSSRSVISIPEQIKQLQSPNELIESAKITMDGKVFEIKRNPDKTKPDVTTVSAIEVEL